MPIRPCIFTDEVAADFDEAVRRSVEAGAEGLELRGKLFGKSITQIDDADVERIQAVCERHGARVAVIGSPIGKCDLEDPDECGRHQTNFERMAVLAHVFGTDLIRGFALWRPNRSRATDAERPDMERFLPHIVNFLDPIVRLAETEGVRFCLETEGATMVGTAEEARKVMHGLGDSPAIGVTWDPDNALECGESPYPEAYSLIRGRIYHFHVKPDPAKSLSTIGSTSVTYEEVLTALRRGGYDGWASIEHWGSPEEMLHGLRELKPLLARVSGA